ncbi:MAG: 5'/3'-nucleotidase SurE [Sphingobium sp.]|nr:5'/3'-nucleotidase SurE [Sphingobium sp.]
MRVLITNDDGADAYGLSVLQGIAESLTDDVWVVAPQQSGASRSIALHAPIRVHQHSARFYEVHGTPTDCVRVAVFDILKDCRPALILSGVNHGQNVGGDIFPSGTVAAAIQGSSLGIPSIALSQALPPYEDTTEIFWDAAQIFGPTIVRALVDSGAADQTVLNVNFPACRARDVRAVLVTSQGFEGCSATLASSCTDSCEGDHYWMRFRARDEAAEGTDLHAIANGSVSVTPLQIDMTVHSLIENLKDDLGVISARSRERKPLTKADVRRRLTLVRS